MGHHLQGKHTGQARDGEGFDPQLIVAGVEHMAIHGHGHQLQVAAVEEETLHREVVRNGR